MKSKLINTFKAFWLIVVTPVFGILPILAVLPFGFISRAAWQISLAIARQISVIFFGDSAPGVMDAGPPLTDFHLGVIGFTTFGIACLLIYASRKAKIRS